MRSGDAVPRVDAGTVIHDMLHEMTSKGLGFTAVCDAGGKVAGIFTDGDLRRLIETGADLRAMRAGDVMQRGAEAGARRRARRRCRRADGAASHHRRARRRSQRPAGRRDQLERPDAREGHLSG